MPAENTLTNPSLAYLRLQGRNERGYITGKSVPERFDYGYSADEFDGIAARVTELAGQAHEVQLCKFFR